MLEANVEIVRASAAAFNRGDLDAWLEYWTDASTTGRSRGAPDEHGPIHGRDALRVYAQGWLDTFRMTCSCLTDRRGNRVRTTLNN